MKNIFFVLLLFVGVVLFAADTVLENQYCFTKPAGGTTGGAKCATKACYLGDGGVYYRQVGIAYDKCTTFEGEKCKESEGGTAGNGGPICAQSYRYGTMDDCKNEMNGSTSQAYYSDFHNCEVIE